MPRSSRASEAAVVAERKSLNNENAQMGKKKEAK